MAKLLIVDDEITGAQLLADFLGSRGHQARVAGDGRRALELAAAEPPDVLIIDFILPDMHGTDVARELRRSQPGLEVIVVSGVHPDEVRENATDLERLHVRLKPLELDELVELVSAAEGRADLA